MRYVVLDTETTGLDPDDGHKIIEIGCVEILNRNVTDNTFHKYINPEREIDLEASKVHGLTLSNLKEKPVFKDILNDFLEYISDSPLIIHNAPFDIGFLQKEYSYIQDANNLINNEVIDSLKLARKISPGKRNSLDALCDRYSIDNSDRTRHGALLDARLLAFVYLKMTIGQNNFDNLTTETIVPTHSQDNKLNKIRVIKANKKEIELHENYFK
tara:strand:- start:2849 stop:3490 length:642 start_codon:yes stop_codon:yes gene_type:complete